MKSLNLFSKIFYVLGFISISGSITLSFINKEDVSWKFIALMWMISALLTEIRISKLEEKK